MFKPKSFLVGCFIGLFILFGYVNYQNTFVVCATNDQDEEKCEEPSVTPSITPNPCTEVELEVEYDENEWILNHYDSYPCPTPTTELTPTLSPVPTPSPDPSPTELPKPTQTPTNLPTTTPEWKQEKVIYFPGEGGVYGPRK